MKAERIIVRDGVVKYSYKYSDLKEFLTQGYKTGNNGLILISVDGPLLEYRGFGTIEAPCKELRTIVVEYCKEFDGDLVLYESCTCNNTVEFSHSIVFFDFADTRSSKEI